MAPPLPARPARPGWRGRLAPVVRVARALTALGITAFLIWQVASGWSTIREIEPRANVGEVVLAALLGSLGLLGLPAGFLLTVRRAGMYRERTALYCFRVWLESYYYRYVPGKVLLAAERVRLGRVVGLSAASTLAFLLWESVLLIVSACVVGMLTLGLAVGERPGQALGWLALALAASVAMLLAFPRVLKLLGRSGWVQSKLGDLERLRLDGKTQLALVGIYVLVWWCFGSAFFLVARWFVPLGWELYPDVVFWFVSGYVIGFVSSITPAGLGVREGFLIVGLSSLVAPGQAAVIAIVGRLWATLIEGLWVGAARFVPMPASSERVE